jgi:diketogulonate reductase-like aldo/keto reductase
MQNSLHDVSSRTCLEFLSVERYFYHQLALTFVDLYLVHFPRLLDDFESGWREFESLKEDGLTK